MLRLNNATSKSLATKAAWCVRTTWLLSAALVMGLCVYWIGQCIRVP
jgi:hypothetical protein